MKTLKVLLVGAGNRGQSYTNLMTDDRFKVVGVSEPSEKFRNYIKEKHGISDSMCFGTWEPLLEKEKCADIVIISTMDRFHYEPCIKAIEKGYDILLEKPISPDFRECVSISNAAKKNGTKILVCHVLRYTPFFMKIKEMIDNKKLGKVLSIHHSECVGNIHQSHSFVRGNWGNSDRSSPMILQKSCHDMDIIQWLMGSSCKNVHSFGALTYFTRENAPKGAPDYCNKTCPVFDNCYYNAVKLYLEDDKNLWFREVATKKTVPTNEEVKEALKNTQYGKCVYKCDNNVVDHQVVNLEFENGGVASFNMCAFNQGGRYIRIMGTDGELYGNMEAGTIEYYSFATRTKEMINATNQPVDGSAAGGHGGGDSGIINSLYDYIANECPKDNLSEIEISTKNHLIAFAAEKSRVENKIVNLEEFQNELGLK